MADTARKPKVGVLALTLDLYESLAPGLRENRQEWLRKEALSALAPHADIVFDAAVFRRQDIDATVAAYEAKGVDCLLVVLLTYSPSQLAMPALKRTRLPILIWNTQELWAVDNTFDGVGMVNNHGVHGTQDLGNVLLRSGVKFEYVTSHLRDPEALIAVVDFMAAAAAVNRLRHARLGILGYPFPGMGDFALDTTHLAASLGCQWDILPIEEYIRGAVDASPAEVGAIKNDYRRLYAVANDVTEADLDLTARVEASLRGMISRRGLSAMTYQFTAFGDDERTPTVPFVAASRLMAEGIGFGGEGDLTAAAGTALLNWLCTPASFCEIFTIDFGGNSVFMSHMGEANVAMAKKSQKPPLVARPAPITRTQGRQLALAFAMEHGPATLCALTQGPAGRWRLIASQMQIPDFGPLSSMQVPQFKLVPQGDVRDFLTAYAKAGGPHHSAVSFGDARARLKQTAQLLGADYIEV